MYIQFRLTPEFCVNPEKTFINRFLAEFTMYLRTLGEIEHHAMAWEKTNKFGESTHKHLHWNIVLDQNFKCLNKDSIMAWIRRQPMGIKGNKCYSLKIVGDPEDEDRWWRYIIKESDPWRVAEFPPDFNLEIQKQLAREERAEQIKKNLASRDKLLKKDSFRLRIFAKMKKQIEDQGNPVVDDKYLWCEFVKLYQKDNRIPPFNTMDNLVLDYKVTTGIITVEDYYNETHH